MEWRAACFLQAIDLIDEGDGRTRARTWDPLIKSYPSMLLFTGGVIGNGAFTLDLSGIIGLA